MRAPLAAALVVDDEKRAAVGKAFAAGAVRLQLDVTPLAAAIALGPAAGRSPDVSGIAECREQWPVGIGRLVMPPFHAGVPGNDPSTAGVGSFR